MDMMERCNIALENAGYRAVSSKNTILDDLAAIERDFPEAKIVTRKFGRYVYYEYEDKKFSIYNIPLDDDGMAKLAQTISILSKFEGMPNFDWVDEMIDHFKLSLNIPTTKDTVVAFDDNFCLHNRNHFSQLFSAIVSEQPLVITYAPFGKPVKEYTFHPYFLKQFNNRWFLFGCVDGKDWLSNFPFDRIVKIDKATIPYCPNTQYDFSEIFEDIVGVSNLFDEPVVIQFRVSPESYDYIKTKPILPCQKELHTDSSDKIFEINTVINRELIQVILSYGSAITVLNPQKLIEEITSTLKKI